MNKYKTKISVTIPEQLSEFIEFYMKSHNEYNRSHIIAKALELLRQKELELAYQEANEEIDSVFDISVGDGLDEER